VRYHFIREILDKGLIVVQYKPTTEQIADVLTKALGNNLHHRFINMSGVKPVGGQENQRTRESTQH
jgi:hypothetical protein